MTVYFIIIFSCFILICTLGAVLYKIRRVHLKLFELENSLTKKVDAVFVELEALINLRGILEMTGDLPSTRGWAASPDFLLTVARDALEKKPQRILECSSGVSTLVLAAAARQNGHGHVYSLEHDSKFAEVTRKNLDSHQLSAYATVIDAPLGARDEYNWYTFEGKLPPGKFDMLVVDGPPKSVGQLARYPAMHFLYEKLNAGSRIFVDDFDRSDERTMVERWKIEFPLEQQFSGYHEKGCAILEIPTD